MSSKQRALFFTTLGAALLLGLTLQWPSLGGGFRGDDYVQAAMARGVFAAPRGKLDLFSFAAGTPADYKQLVDFGHLPWWTHPELRLRMWRPIASALMAVDFELFGNDARLHHVHSLLWLCLLLIAAGRLFWRVLPPLPAAGALLLFAASPCHTLPVGWLANRSTLVACTFAFVALELQLRGMKLACALASCIALLCGEYALSALTFGVCMSLLSPRGGTRAEHRDAAGAEPREASVVEHPSPRDGSRAGPRDAAGVMLRGLRGRLLDAWPVLVPLCGYLVLHALLGNEIVHSGYYISPFGAPADFLRALFTRVPVLTADLLFGLPSYYFHSGSPLRAWVLSLELVPPEIWVQLPDWATGHVVVGYLALAAGAALFLWMPKPQRPPAWLALGTLLALVPCAGSLPEDRLLTAATLGASALVACALVAAVRALLPGWRKLLLCTLIAWVPVSALARSYDDVRAIRHGSEVARAWCMDAELPDADAASTRVYVVTTADFNTAVNLPWLRWLEGNKPLPQSYRRLSPGALPVMLQRTSERVLDVRIVVSDVYGSAVPGLYRDGGAPVMAGELHMLPGVVVHVLEAYASNPIHMRFEFDRSLDDPSLWFLAATERGLRRISLPALGSSMLVPFAQYRDVRPAPE